MLVGNILVVVKSTELSALAALEDPVRAELYNFVRRSAIPVTREEAARALRISKKLAAFHLDKLVERGLLRADQEVPEGMTRRVGRAPKRYSPSELQISLSLPERRYQLVGEILLDSVVDAIGKRDDEPLLAVARRVARERGEAMGVAEREARHLVRPGAERALAAAEQILEELGYQPVVDQDDGGLLLGNCPFHALMQRAPELVCSLNAHFINGVLRGLGNESFRAELVPKEGWCCVHLCDSKRAAIAH